MPVRPRRLVALGLLCGLSVVAAASVASTTTIYKWTDADGTVHLSTTRPPAGVKYETRTVAGASQPKSASGPRAGTSRPSAGAHTAERAELLASLRNRECVIALEALDRLTSGTQPTSATEIHRLQQTVEANCSRSPAMRREQEDMAAKLRVANGPECMKARNTLADMQARRVQATPEQQRAQQAFVDEHCVPPVQ
ncbi:MAG: DUF4124 domain-containing protein [Steroidobacteraceae bacterium]